jgi:hypothetical protein
MGVECSSCAVADKPDVAPWTDSVLLNRFLVYREVISHTLFELDRLRLAQGISSDASTMPLSPGFPVHKTSISKKHETLSSISRGDDDVSFFSILCSYGIDLHVPLQGNMNSSLTLKELYKLNTGEEC